MNQSLTAELKQALLKHLKSTGTRIHKINVQWGSGNDRIDTVYGEVKMTIPDAEQSK